MYFYTKVDDSRVTPSIKRKAHALVGTFQEHLFNFCSFYNAEPRTHKKYPTKHYIIDKWSRPIVKLSQDYRTKKINYAEGDQSAGQRRRYDGASAAAASAE